MPPPHSSNQSNAVAEDMETLSYVHSLVEAFRAFDSDTDGMITGDELKGMMTSLGYNVSAQEVRDMMRRGDTDRDGLLSLEEFLEMNTAELELGDLAGLLQTAAASLGGGSAVAGGDHRQLTAEDLFQVLGEASMEDCMDIIACLDVDGDGTVSVEDLRIIAQALL